MVLLSRLLQLAVALYSVLLLLDLLATSIANKYCSCHTQETTDPATTERTTECTQLATTLHAVVSISVVLMFVRKCFVGVCRHQFNATVGPMELATVWIVTFVMCDVLFFVLVRSFVAGAEYPHCSDLQTSVLHSLVHRYSSSGTAGITSGNGTLHFIASVAFFSIKHYWSVPTVCWAYVGGATADRNFRGSYDNTRSPATPTMGPLSQSPFSTVGLTTTASSPTSASPLPASAFGSSGSISTRQLRRSLFDTPSVASTQLTSNVVAPSVSRRSGSRQRGSTARAAKAR